MRKLDQLTFENTYARLPAKYIQRVAPTPVPDPFLVAFSADAARLIDLDPAESERPEFAEIFAGNSLLPGSEPVAMRYAGHQFGVFVPQLGDGRAILLGEVKNVRGEKWDLHLKGAGRTAFSRFGDGRAVLRSCIREYLCSEAMHALGIPTTRALCIVGHKMEVYRETAEPGAVLLRLAPSHVRFGTFEVFSHRDEHDAVTTLVDYVIENHFPELMPEHDRYLRFFEQVVRRTARLVAEWQAVGFAHGVLNTDNMSILGLTIDYGPFGFMESFDPGFICNHSDELGRYAFDQQARIGYANLACLAHALSSLIPEDSLRQALSIYPVEFNAHIHSLMCRKIGLIRPTEDDRQLWMTLMDLLADHRCDCTIFFRKLAGFRTAPAEKNANLTEFFDDPARWLNWSTQYRQRLLEEDSCDPDRCERMNRINPKFILRNYLAQVAIDKAVHLGDFTELARLHNLLRNPYDEQPEMEQYAQAPPEWGRHLVVSCSS
jgi:uncharacterized protein YdiU (UPF0061 family)